MLSANKAMFKSRLLLAQLPVQMAGPEMAWHMFSATLRSGQLYLSGFLRCITAGNMAKLHTHAHTHTVNAWILEMEIGANTAG